MRTISNPVLGIYDINNAIAALPTKKRNRNEGIPYVTPREIAALKAIAHFHGKDVRAEVLHPKGVPPHASYVFRHALIHETAYESLLRATRKEFHAQIAEALEDRFRERLETEPELAARHFEGAERWQKAAPYYQRAGARAAERSAHAEAVAYFRKALELVERLPDTAERKREELRVQSALAAISLGGDGPTGPSQALPRRSPAERPRGEDS